MALSESHKAVLLAELKANKVTNALKVYDSYCDCFLTLGPVSNSMVMQLEVVSRLLPFPLLLPSCRIDTIRAQPVRYLFRAEQPRNGNWHWLYFSSAQFSDI